MNLNPQQHEAVHHFGGPLLIIAGAGAGKTMVLTHKIQYMVTELGIYPNSILAITFTNKAAKEMRDRVGRLLNQPKTAPYVSTFHSLCNDILRREFHHFGRPAQFVILDQSDQTRIVKHLLKEADIDDKKYPPALVLSVIDRIKNTLTTVSGYDRDPKRDPVIASLYGMYQQHLETQNALDFNDLLMMTVQLFHQFPDVLDRYQTQFPIIMVDEYQDTNHAQFALVQALAKKFRNITVVGDFDQTIYTWRGASVHNILQFERYYPDATVIKLEENYRSTSTILKAANTLITHNTQRKDKSLWTQNPAGDPIGYYCGGTERDEANFIAREILKLQRTGVALEDVAILYRTNAQSRVLEETMTQFQIPYRMIGGMKYLQRAEIKDISAYLRLVFNPHDNAAFTRAIAVPSRGVGDTSIEKLMILSTQTAKSIYGLWQSDALPVGPRQSAAIGSLFEKIDSWGARFSVLQSEKIGTLIRMILEESGYQAYLASGAIPNGQDRIESIMELITLSNEEDVELGEFLSKLSLSSDWDQAEPDTAGQLTLMTLHHAKGLEFNVVFLAGMEEGLLPHFRSKTDDEIEEERRLCYVGITRGRQRVILTGAQSRLFQGELRTSISSRFLRELPPELIDQLGLKILQPRTVAGVSTGGPKPAQAPARGLTSYSVGEWVTHGQWGKGQILSMDGTGENAVLHISFSGMVKKLMAKYAPIRKLGG